MLPLYHHSLPQLFGSLFLTDAASATLKPPGAPRSRSRAKLGNYSGTSLGYQLASIIVGGPSPFIATALFATFASSFPIALYILGCSILGIIAAAMLTDYTNKDISEE